MKSDRQMLLKDEGTDVMPDEVRSTDASQERPDSPPSSSDEQGEP
jgi:hypothetical protein